MGGRVARSAQSEHGACWAQIGSRLRARRTHLGLSINNVARELGIETGAKLTNSGKVKGTRILAALMREMCGTATQKLELFEKLKAARMLKFEDSWDIKKLRKPCEHVRRKRRSRSEGGRFLFCTRR